MHEEQLSKEAMRNSLWLVSKTIGLAAALVAILAETAKAIFYGVQYFTTKKDNPMYNNRENSPYHEGENARGLSDLSKLKEQEKELSSVDLNIPKEQLPALDYFARKHDMPLAVVENANGYTVYFNQDEAAAFANVQNNMAQYEADKDFKEQIDKEMPQEKHKAQSLFGKISNNIYFASQKAALGFQERVTKIFRREQTEQPPQEQEAPKQKQSHQEQEALKQEKQPKAEQQFSSNEPPKTPDYIFDSIIEASELPNNAYNQTVDRAASKLEYDMSYVQMNKRMNEAIDKANVYNATMGKMKTPEMNQENQKNEKVNEQKDEPPDKDERG